MSIVKDTNLEKSFKTDEMVINMGPQHPSCHGVLRLILTLDGEIVRHCEPVIGYLHRGMEWLGQNRTYVQYQALVDRVDYLAGMSDSHAYIMAVEKIAGIKVPLRAEYIRVICAELNRIISHVLWLGVFLLDLGAMTGFPFYTFRDRETILSFLEEVSGQRMMFNYIRIGGVFKDLPKGWTKKVKKWIASDFIKYIDEYEAIVTKNPIFLVRTNNVGYLDPKLAIDRGVTGPCLRASGVNIDLRKYIPYSVYDKFNFNVPVSTTGDTNARYACRVQELRESAKIVIQAIDNLPGGDTKDLEENKTELTSGTNPVYKPEDLMVLVKGKNVPPSFKCGPGEAYAAVESPRGQLGVHLIADGTSVPYRIKWRSPSFNNVSVLPDLIKGSPIADVIAIFGGLDVILPDVDR
ncbi:MAG: NADH-quinone oxidoreductase subunit D [Candidatus Melainabacteria bacterium]|nr:NADH-quinone oxidoreductase subunit D [Candidatus Melainabacteria bacterium]